MTLGNIAALIAAIAFAVLVIFISMNLSKVMQVIDEVQDTVKRLNTTIDVVTKDVDNLSIEIEGLLNKANTLVDDVNGKLSKTDPLFVAIGDLGESVSDLNNSTRNLTSNLVANMGSGSNKRARRAKSAFQGLQKIRKSKPKSTSPRPDIEVQGRASDQVKSGLSPDDQLRAYINKKPSQTAGEIKLK